ncbi:MAG: hypothetical protein PHE50_06720 [Dehalococcoidales bacterium]|nr:hypothetical protein [Dehalococcoidales bacterium]
MENKIAEVIAAGSAEFTAECYELYNIPPLGSLVKTINEPVEIIGVVGQSMTSGFEPGRRPIARGKDEASEAAVYQTNPQLTKLLRSEFQVVVIGHKNGANLFQYLPPKPAHIHGFVLPCSSDEIQTFSRSFDFLNLLMHNEQIPPEELIAAALREMSRVQPDPSAFLIAAGKKLTGLMSGDYQKLKAVLGRLTL